MTILLKTTIAHISFNSNRWMMLLPTYVWRSQDLMPMVFIHVCAHTTHEPVMQTCLWILSIPRRKREHSHLATKLKQGVLVIFPIWLFIFSYRNETECVWKSVVSVPVRQNKMECVPPLRQTQETPYMLNMRGWRKNQISQDIFVVAYASINWSTLFHLFIILLASAIILPICKYSGPFKLEIQQI